MLTKDVLVDGSVRLTSGECGFLFFRLCPGTVYTQVRGVDSGGLDSAPLDEIKSEYEHFGVPVTWFIYAEKTALAGALVSEQWTAWLINHSSLFNTVHVFSENKKLHLTIEVAKHFSNTTRLLINYRERTGFEGALFESIGSGHVPRDDWFSERPIAMLKSRQPDGTVRIENQLSAFTFLRFKKNAVWTTINGVENGSLGNAPFDHMREELKRCSGKLVWFVDCSEVARLDSRILESWIQWTIRHQSQLAALHMYVPKGAIPLLIDIAKLRSRNQGLIHLYRSRDAFDRVSEFCPLSSGSVS